MELNEMRERILGIPLIKGLPESMRERFVMMLLYVSQTKRTFTNEQLFIEGEHDENTGVALLDGMVRIIRENEDPISVEAPDILGEIQQFTRERRRTATVEVCAGGQVLSFRWGDLRQAASAYYSHEELATLRSHLRKTAWARAAEALESGS